MAHTDFTPQDPHYESRVRASFERQQVMKTIGAFLSGIGPGRVVVEMPYSPAYTQQHGFLHAGILGTLLDTACGYAAFTLMPDHAAILTVEYKVNLLAPGKGQLFRAEANVVKPGRTLFVVEGRVFATDDGRDKLVATMTATEMTIVGRDDVRH